MEYAINRDLFDSNFINSSGSFTHNQGRHFKLFPFLTSPNGEIRNLDGIIGRVLCDIEGIEPQETNIQTIFDEIKNETQMQPDQEKKFYEIIKQLFFDDNDRIRPLNLRMIEQHVCDESNEKRLAEYLADVLGNRDILKNSIIKSNNDLMNRSNVLEQLLFSKFGIRQVNDNISIKYFNIVNSLREKFEEDFDYILASTARVRDYLIPLFEFYYFSYTAQAFLQLDRFFDGERDKTIPLYFSLDWEVTSQSRRCYSEGWQKLQVAIKKGLAHAVTLEMLNLTEDECERVDYISLKQMVVDFPEKESEIRNQVSYLAERYKEAITDCPEMDLVERGNNQFSELETEVEYLFELIKTQFENKREAPYGRYSKKFEDFCSKYLKNRRRSGLMLNLTEETLIFLTKIAIKNRDKVRLIEVFDEFEQRGVFLDDSSKNQIAQYYEKLNLIEKKSDSGDAKYVKRIL